MRPRGAPLLGFDDEEARAAGLDPLDGPTGPLGRLVEVRLGNGRLVVLVLDAAEAGRRARLACAERSNSEAA